MWVHLQRSWRCLCWRPHLIIYLKTSAGSLMTTTKISFFLNVPSGHVDDKIRGLVLPPTEDSPTEWTSEATWLRLQQDTLIQCQSQLSVQGKTTWRLFPTSNWHLKARLRQLLRMAPWWPSHHAPADWTRVLQCLSPRQLYPKSAIASSCSLAWGGTSCGCLINLNFRRSVFKLQNRSSLKDSVLQIPHFPPTCLSFA